MQNRTKSLCKIDLKMYFKVTTFVLIISITSCLAFSGGSGSGACVTMMPNHGSLPQGTVPPVSIRISQSNVPQGRTMTLAIEGIDIFVFRGFLIQARSFAENPRVLGSFHITPQMRILDCDTHPQNSVATHVNSAFKGSVDFIWEAPLDYLGMINFQ